MQEATPQSKRQRSMMDTEFDAVTKRFKETTLGPASKAEKRFARKVLKVVDGVKPTGQYISSFTCSIPLYLPNSWSVIETGDKGTLLSFFQPLQFKDAEAICFLKKVATDATAVAGTGWNNETGNNTKLANVRVVNSSVYMNFKSNSSMKMILEIYEISGKSTLSYFESQPFNLVWAAYVAETLAAGAAGTNVVTGPIATCLKATISQVPSLLSDFNIKKTVIKFQPGEEASHFIQGPKNYTMNSSKKILSSGGWPNWSLPGNGIKVMFRVTTDINMAYYTQGVPPDTSDNNVNVGARFNIGHWENTLTASDGGPGCIIADITRHYTVEAPDGTPPAAAIPIGAPAGVPAEENFRPACVIFNNYGKMTENEHFRVMNMVPGTGTPGADPTRD